MNSIPINEAETIFEPFWDGGESYPCPGKYGVLSNYKVESHPSAIATVKQTWCSAEMNVERSAGADVPSLTISRDCSLILDGYDRMQCRSSFPKQTRLTVSAVIDGEERTVIDAFGSDSSHEISGELCGHLITHLSISFYCEEPSNAVLFWIGLANRKKQEEMRKKTSGFSSDWEGCFEEHPRLTPRIGMFATEEELQRYRQKIKNPPFREMYEHLLKQVKEDMTLVPEDYIGEFALTGDVRWTREHDLHGGLKIWAIIYHLVVAGALEQDEEMLRLAARWALSVSCCKNWCEGVVGAFPGATWHHRSFAEDTLLAACAMTLDLAGNLLTWHGRNIIHNAMVLKGLSRMDADFGMMEYIHQMNQGIAFSYGRIAGLIALTFDYPRFGGRIDEAERTLGEILDCYIRPDGGCAEGPSYWQYSILSGIDAYWLLARYRKQPFETYLPASVVRSEQYALAVLSSLGDGTEYLAINDAPVHGRFERTAGAVFSRVGRHRDSWKTYYVKRMVLPVSETEPTLSWVLLDLGDGVEKSETTLPEKPFWKLSESGHTVLWRQTDDCGTVRSHFIAGPKIFSHSHSDSGSFLLEAGGESFLTDMGSASYDGPFTAQMQKAISHNVFVPLQENGLAYDQLRSGEGKTVYADWENGVFTYTADLKAGWEDGLFRTLRRHVFSSDPHTFLVMDEAEYETPHAASVMAVTGQETEIRDGSVILKGENVWVTMTALNWSLQPEIQRFGKNRSDRVRRIWMKTGTANKHRLITAFTVSKAGTCSSCEWTAKAENGGFSVTDGTGTYFAGANGWSKG